MQKLNGSQSEGVLAETAYAKLNFSLKIKGRRADGYHELESLVGFAEFGDRVRLRPASGFTVRTTGPFAEQISGVNLVAAVGQHLLSTYGDSHFGLVDIEKCLPVAAGLGGGSADAGALVRLFERHFKITLQDEEIAALGPLFGADVPVCVRSKPCLMRGIGADIHEMAGALPPMGLLLVNPGVPVSTAAVFEAMNAPALDDDGEREQVELAVPSFTALSDLLDYMKEHPNDMTEAACSLAPEIEQVLGALEALPACLMARMAGSGASCFGVFETPDAARQASDALRASEPGWWIVATAPVGSLWE